MVEEAQKQKAPIERILGALVWWGSGDILRAITILIVFCPCVMVLATPTALVASIGNAALKGSLVKKGATIEAMAKVTAVAFDKTGTLTFGQPKLTAIQPLGQLTETELLRLAAIAEKLSEHPLGRAVVHAAIAHEVAVPDPEEFTVLPGLGVQARINEGEVVIGRPRLLSEQGIAVGEDVAAHARNLAAVGRTVILVARNRLIVGMLVLEDTLRPEASQVITRLKKLSIRTVLVTGDRERRGGDGPGWHGRGN
jgi:Zn2+/Cd2+-exporting ATPase